MSLSPCPESPEMTKGHKNSQTAHFAPKILYCGMFRTLLFIAILGALASCSNKYHKFESNYRFSDHGATPKYNSLDVWAAHPDKKDPSDSIPEPLTTESRDTTVDVFFLHPTTYTSLKRMKGDNMDVDDPYTDAKTDYSTILYQATAFNQHAHVYAPRYRQAHISMFYSKDKARAARAFDTAYNDIKTAFIYYLENWNRNRPFIIAAHSQGSFLAERLIKEFFDDPANPYYRFRNKMIVAYIAGWPVPKDYYSTVPMCSSPEQTGCLCSWRTMKKGFVPSYLKEENGNAYATNPLSWTMDSLYVDRDYNKGSILTNFNKLVLHTTDAQLHNGLLWVNKPRFPGSFLIRSRNYHIGDINLYYVNIRRNVTERINAYWKR